MAKINQRRDAATLHRHILICLSENKRNSNIKVSLLEIPRNYEGNNSDGSQEVIIREQSKGPDILEWKRRGLLQERVRGESLNIYHLGNNKGRFSYQLSM